MFGGGLFKGYMNIHQSLRKTDHLRKNIQRRRQERTESIAFVSENAKLLDAKREADIISWNFNTLREKLQNDEVTPSEVLRAYQSQAVKAQERTNCVTLFLKEAVDWAKDLENEAKKPGFKKPPFYGIPISIKELFNVAGYESTWGFTQGVGLTAYPEDSIPVKRFKEMGFIPFVHTNVPQSCMAYHSNNPLYGSTTHPDDPTRTSGGSSGGESAMVGCGGSIFGIGNDLGGSVRIPASYVGLAAMKLIERCAEQTDTNAMRVGRVLMTVPLPKDCEDRDAEGVATDPSSRRTPQARPDSWGLEKVWPSDGPFSKDVDSIVQFYQQYWKYPHIHNADPYFAPVEWNDEYYRNDRKYTIGYYVDDGYLTPVPAYKRAVLEAKEHLEAQGHKLVPFSPPNVREMMRNLTRICFYDAGKELRGLINNDICEPSMLGTYWMFYVPIWIQRLAYRFYKNKEPRFADLLLAMTRDSSDVRGSYKYADNYRFQFYAQMKQQGIDALLSPPQVMAAPKLDVPADFLMGLNYTALYNFLDYAAGVINVTKVTEADEKAALNYKVTDRYEKIIKESAEGSTGLPINVQIAAPPFREEIVLRLLRDIEIGKSKQ